MIRTIRVPWLALVVGMGLFTEAGVASAQGLELGVRTGYGIPLGKVADDATGDMNEVVDGVIPIWLDLGQRVSPDLMVGVYGMYAFGVLDGELRDNCDKQSADCSAHDIRAGIELHYHLLPDQTVDPWIGMGADWEWFNLSVSQAGDDYSATATGPNLTLQLGLDVKPSGSIVAFGPFASFSFGEFIDRSCSGPGLSCSSPDDKSMHNWLMVGVRATVQP